MPAGERQTLHPEEAGFSWTVDITMFVASVPGAQTAS